VQFVELEFSTSENLLVKKLRSKIKEDSQISFYYKSRFDTFRNGIFLLKHTGY